MSGGHTSLYLVEDIGRYRQLGRTRDDAAGEAFDKGAKMLGLGFPGGRRSIAVPRRATAAIRFHARPSKPGARRDQAARARGASTPINGGYDFSFSGVKTSLRQSLHPTGSRTQEGARTQEARRRHTASLEDVCASFQEAIIDMLVGPGRTERRRIWARRRSSSPAVSANSRLRTAMTRRELPPAFDVAFPRFAYCTDNAAMIGYAGRARLLRGERHDLGLNAAATLPIGVA